MFLNLHTKYAAPFACGAKTPVRCVPSVPQVYSLDLWYILQPITCTIAASECHLGAPRATTDAVARRSSIRLIPEAAASALACRRDARRSRSAPCSRACATACAAPWRACGARPTASAAPCRHPPTAAASRASRRRPLSRPLARCAWADSCAVEHQVRICQPSSHPASSGSFCMLK